MESPSIRIYGPYQHNGGWRCQIEVNGRRRWGPMAKTAQRAEKLAIGCTDQIQAAHPLTVTEALDRYRGHLARKGNKPTSIENTLGKLHRFFRSVLADVLVRLTKSRAATLYDKLSREPSDRTGKPLSADSHRNMLAEAKTFLSWCAEQRWIGGNPLASVKGVGKRRHGKPQLRIDEARKLRAVCHQQAADGDDGAIAVLIGLLMGLRASEIVSRTVRDLDDGGRLLWIPDSKTDAGRRTVAIPDELQPYLRERSEGKRSADLLFVAPRGGEHWRDWVAKSCKRLCRLAAVPEVCAHSLRGFTATVALRAGETPHLVAAALGHEKATTTLTSYAQRGSAEHARQRRVVELLGNDETAEIPPQPAREPTFWN